MLLHPLSLFVCVKQVLDPRILVQIENECTVIPDDIAPIYIIDPASQAALEIAMTYKETSGASVSAVTMGPERCEAVLRFCLARGVDEVIHIVHPDDASYDLFFAAKLTGKVIQEYAPDLVLCGDRSCDDGSACFGPFLAEMMNLPQVTSVVDLELIENRMIRAVRSLERGNREVVNCPLPALISVCPVQIHPRYITVWKLHSVNELPIKKIIVSQADAPAVTSPCLTKITPPRARPRRMSAPDSAMTASQRLRFMMDKGQPKNKASEPTLFEGSVDQAVDRIIEFLHEKGIV